MRPSIVVRSAPAVLLFASAAALAGGGVRARGFEVGVSGGVQSGDANEDVGTDSSFNLRIGFAFTQKLMAELIVNSFDTTRPYTGVAGNPTQPASQDPFSHEAGTELVSYAVALTANFLTERDIKTSPYVTVGLGVVEESRDGASFLVNDPDAPPPATQSLRVFLDTKDTGTLLSLGTGARTFFTNWLGVRYEVRFIHYDTFEVNQDGFEGSIGATFVFGGKK